MAADPANIRPIEAELGRALESHRRGQWQDAERRYAEVLRLMPGHARASHLLGVLRCQQGRLAEGLGLLESVVTSAPASAEAWADLGEALGLAGERMRACVCLRRHAELRPLDAQAHARLGEAFASCGLLEDALTSANRALALDPANALLWNNRGAVLLSLGRSSEALADFRRAVQLRSGYAQAHLNEGSALLELGETAESIQAFQRALACQPNWAELHYNLGIALSAANRLEESLRSFDRAIALRPGYPAAHNNRGMLLVDLARFDEAVECFHRALQVDPEFTEAHCNVALAHLLHGRYDEGWALYEQRWRDGNRLPYRHAPIPRWRGSESLTGKRILLWTEQGFGDAIQFARFAPMAASLGATVVLEAPRPLQDLFRSLDGVAEVHAIGDSIAACDYQVPFMSLALAFGTRVSTVPSAVPYLRADPRRAAAWESEISRSGRLRVGLAYRGSRVHRNDQRWIPLRQMAPLLRNYQLAQFVLVQTEIDSGDESLLQENQIRDYRAKLGDFADTAALLHCLDLVICVDTAVAHLAGALGKETWILLPFSPDWRWMLRRKDSPWYPSVRLFRQKQFGNWQPVIDEMCEALRNRCAHHAASPFEADAD